jgi:hypothetical protein
MLGDIIYEQKGKISSQRVLDVKGPKIESTSEGNGVINGIEVTDLVTFYSIPVEDKQANTIYAEGYGVITSKDGEMATWKGYGIGRQSGNKQTHRGSVFMSTSSTGNLSFLNNKVGVFEYEIGENGNNSGKIWEWK